VLEVSQPDDVPLELEAGLAALVRRAQAGDRDAFGELYIRHVRVVHGIVLAHGADADPADIVHDVSSRRSTGCTRCATPPRSGAGSPPSHATLRT